MLANTIQDVYSKAMRLEEDVISKMTPRKVQMLTIATVVGASIQNVFADGFDDLATQMQTVYNSLLPFLIVLAAVVLCICAAFYFISKDEKRADAAFHWGIRVLVGCAVIFIGPWIIKSLHGLLSGMTSTSLDDIKSLGK